MAVKTKPVYANGVQSALHDPDHPIGYWVCMFREFIDDSVRLIRKCTKPDAKEFNSVLWACSVGLFAMGFISFFVKLMFIPINNIIVGSGRK